MATPPARVSCLTHVVEIRRLGPDDLDALLAASPLFDGPAVPGFARRFLDSPDHVLLVAYDDARPVGFVSGVETTHPDKGTEMFLYELAVDESARRRGVGTALVVALRDLARERGCYGMWVLTETDNEAALATNRAAAGTEESTPVLLAWTFAAS
jgi:ribosomal protein S18 acetylase RimI-like enzyme